MKRACLFLFFIAHYFISDGQNYSGQYSGAIHFYTIDSSVVTMIREDSSYSTGMELRRNFQLYFRDITNENIVDSTCQFFSGPNCLYKKDVPTYLGSKTVSGNSFIRYFNFYGDSVNIDFNVSIGDTQTVFQNSSSEVKYICLNRDTTTLFNQSDSLLLFKILHLDSLGVPTFSVMQGDTIIYSKNAGLVNGYALDYFPETLTKITLTGIRNPDFGFHGLTYADCYNYQVGDIFERFKNNYSAPTYEFYTVLTRTDSPGDVNYTFNIIRKSAVGYPPVNYTYDTLQDTQSYSKIYYPDENIENSYYKMNSQMMNSCWTGISLDMNYSDYCVPGYCPSADCYGGMDCYGSWSYEYTYAQYLGLFNQKSTYNIMGQPIFYDDLTYFNIQGQICGSSNILNIENNLSLFLISVYPNPVFDELVINSEEMINNGRVVISDVTGREIFQSVFIKTLTLSLNNIPNGLYVISFYSDKTRIHQQKIVKQ